MRQLGVALETPTLTEQETLQQTQNSQNKTDTTNNVEAGCAEAKGGLALNVASGVKS